MTTPTPGPAGIDTSVPSIARMYDYYLGGDNNFEADRAAADQVIAMLPAVREAAVQNRAFLGAAVRYLTSRAGIAQFLDIGSGLPANNATHQVAHESIRDARVVYVDYDPAVVAHAGVLLTETDRGIAVLGDIRQPAALLADPAIRAHLDFTRPVGVLLLAVLHFVADDTAAAAIAALRDTLAPGSYLVISHVGGRDQLRLSDEDARRAQAAYQGGGHQTFGRSEDEITKLLDGFEVTRDSDLPRLLPGAASSGAAKSLGWRLLARRL